MVETGADIIDLDWMVDMESACKMFGDQVSFSGNFDPVVVMMEGTPDDVYKAATHCMEIGGPRAFSNAGCEIPVRTPEANLLAQAQALRDFGSS